MIACIISAELATFPGSVIFKYVVKTKCHYESPNVGSHHYSGQQKLVLRHYIGMLFKPCKKSEGCCKLRRVVAESSSSFCNKICTCLRCIFYRPSVNLFCSNWRKSPVWRDSIKLWVIIHATYLFKYAFNLKCFFSFVSFFFEDMIYSIFCIFFLDRVLWYTFFFKASAFINFLLT